MARLSAWDDPEAWAVESGPKGFASALDLGSPLRNVLLGGGPLVASVPRRGGRTPRVSTVLATLFVVGMVSVPRIVGDRDGPVGMTAQFTSPHDQPPEPARYPASGVGQHRHRLRRPTTGHFGPGQLPPALAGLIF